MPNPPPVWDQYYPGGAFQQAADWNQSQHSAISQDPGTHAGPTGPTGPIGLTGLVGATGPTGVVGPTGTIPNVGSGKASFKAGLSSDQNLSVPPVPNSPGGVLLVNFEKPQQASPDTFEQGNYFDGNKHIWVPPAGIVFLSASLWIQGNWSGLGQMALQILEIYDLINMTPYDGIVTFETQVYSSPSSPIITVSSLQKANGTHGYAVCANLGEINSGSYLRIGSGNNLTFFCGTLLA
jgi:hypothetical protein